MFCSSNVPAQTHVADISDEEVAYFKSKIDSLPDYIQLGKTISYSQQCLLPSHFEYHINDLSLSIPRAALDLPERLKTPYARMYAWYMTACRFYDAKSYLDADLCWQRAMEIAVEGDFNYEELHVLRPALNNISFLSGNYSRAMRISSEGVIKARKINDRRQLAHFNNVIGYIHMKQRNFEASEKYFNLYLKQSREMRDTLLEAHALYNLADLAIAQQHYDSSLLYAQRSMDVYKSIADRPHPVFTLSEREGYVLNKMAEAAKLKGDLKKALAFALSAVRLTTNTPGVNEYDKANYHINTGDIFNRLQETDSAIT